MNLDILLPSLGLPEGWFVLNNLLLIAVKCTTAD